MFIEKSPFYKTSTSTVVDKTPINANVEVLPDGQEIDESGEFSFWSWFKGLVNPLQNLPLISGIYSSVNSEDEGSDRDLVQNSLGGFLYGGPFGAIAGFGTWVFNKLFEKTPTELALDVTGVSKIWRDEEIDSKEIANNLEKENINPNQSLSNLIERNLTNKKNANIGPQFSNLKNDDQKRNPKINISETNLKKDEKLVSINAVGEKNLLKSNHNSNKKTGDYNYKEINFSYPSWRPHELSIKKFKSLNNKNSSNNQYMEKSEVESLNVKINA